MKTLDSTILQVLAYGRLKPGWNTSESLPPTPHAVLLACEFLRTIPEGLPLPGTMLHDNGDLGFYWYANQRCYVDLEIDSQNDQFSFFAVKKAEGEEPREETYLPVRTIAHFTIPFYIDHYSAIRDEYATHAATVQPSSADAANGGSKCQRNDALPVG
ncbi:hypothetical protein AWB81_01870 [Caballeronia arationis]|uniref:hypothetical protein n=1 Tax=Caballeronia arationis TaxID=1777142 RepID=UPI00074C2956|nr:hypothetical protein [Caballeronia arationis]SAK59620.1 hypothetical protein AWB81_01870 [Caballeronia arationis]